MHSTMLPESSLEVEVELGQRRRKEQKKQTKEELELSLRRKFNRNLKDRQLLIHKASLLSQFGRSHYYNILLNDRAIMEKVLPLLPSQNSYPPQSGTEIKYFTSLTTWFKTTIKLIDSRMYPDHLPKKLKRKYLKKHLIEQIQKKQACCKQDMIFIYVALLRAMRLQCRLVVNLQPLPMKLDKSDLLPLKLTETKKKGKTKPTVEKDTEMSYSEDESLNNIKNGKKVHFNPVEKEKVLTVQEEKRITRNRKPLNLQDKVENTKEDSENVPQKQPNKRTRKNDENIKNNKKEGTDKNKLNAENEPVKGNIELKPFSIRLNRILKDKQNINISETGKSTVLGEPKPELRRLPTRSVSRKRANVPTEQNVESKKSKSQGKIKLELGENPVRITRQRVKNPATKIPQLDGAADEIQAHKKGRTQSKRLQLKTLNKTRSKEESDDDFQDSLAKKPKAPKTEKKSPRAVLSGEDEDLSQKTKSSKKEKNTTDIWVEVWSDKEERWVCIDIFSGKVDSVDAIRKSASNSLAYVFAFQKDLSIKDVTARYCVNWGNVVRISRVDGAWLNTALAKRVPKKTKQDLVEDQELRRIHEEKPLPTSICEYKNHPLYALERHLLQFQALYPPNPPTLGFIRNEPVYPRDCVHLLHSREIWHKDARVVKPGEEPYKIVRRPKWDRINRTILKDQPLEVFGYWQTQKFEPPVAENGIVPRNEYGNVELFKKCMLPKKCVHLRLPGLQRICKKLRIDCANALVGFDFHKGGVHAKYDGFVVCEEFKDTLVEAWNEEQLLIEEKEREKYEARVYGNWKKLIKGLLIKERLKIKYKF